MARKEGRRKIIRFRLFEIRNIYIYILKLRYYFFRNRFKKKKKKKELVTYNLLPERPADEIHDPSENSQSRTTILRTCVFGL